jgi:hypothetical protein
VGCPIRRSRDHQSLASPPGFSQRATSFIASQCQGIHQMPLICSIHSAVRTPKEGAQHPGTPPRTVANPKCPPTRQPRQCYPLDQQLSRRGLCPRTASFHEDTLSNGPITRRFTPQAEPSASVTFTNSLHPVNQHPRGSRPQRGQPRPAEIPGKTQSSPNAIGSQVRSQTPDPFQFLIFVVGSVEVNGIEPMTSCLQSRRSPN